MTDRRQFLGHLTAGAAALGFCGCPFAAELLQRKGSGARRVIRLAGKRARVIDVHAHVNIINVLDRFKEQRSQLENPTAGTEAEWAMETPDERIRWMDEQGIDMQAVGINPFWYQIGRAHV